MIVLFTSSDHLSCGADRTAATSVCGIWLRIRSTVTMCCHMTALSSRTVLCSSWQRHKRTGSRCGRMSIQVHLYVSLSLSPLCLFVFIYLPIYLSIESIYHSLFFYLFLFIINTQIDLKSFVLFFFRSDVLLCMKDPHPLKKKTTHISKCVFIFLKVYLFVFYVPSTAMSFRDGTPICCPLQRM